MPSRKQGEAREALPQFALGGLVLAGLAALLLAAVPAELFDTRLGRLLQLAALSACGGLGLFALPRLPQQALAKAADAFNRRRSWLSVAAACLLLAALLFIARFVLDAFPNSGDEHATVLQALTYAQGNLWVPAPDHAALFRVNRFLDKDGLWVSQYLPGVAIGLALFAKFGVPIWAFNPLIGVAALAALWKLARYELDPAASLAVVVAFASSSFFLLNAASYFPHVIVALWALFAALCTRRAIQQSAAGPAVLVGVCLGLIGVTRPFDAIIFAVPIMAAFAQSRVRWMGLVSVGLGGLPFLAMLLGYHWAITGDPLTTIVGWYGSNPEPLGAPGTHTAALTADRWLRLAGWTSPILALAIPWALVILWRQRKLAFTDFILPAFVVAYLFYGGHGGNQYGPRYIFEAFPFVLLSVMKAAQLWSAASASRFALVVVAITTHVALQVGMLGPRFMLEHRVVHERQDVFQLVVEADLTSAVVIVATPTCPIRPMTPADLTRNGLVVGDRPVIYAQDLGAETALLPRLFPGRGIYVYADGRLTPWTAVGSAAAGLAVK